MHVHIFFYLSVIRGEEERKESRGGSVWENRDARSTDCNQGEMLHVAVVIQACIHVAVVIHTCLLLPLAMTLRDMKVRVSKIMTGSSVGVIVITMPCVCHCAAGQQSLRRLTLGG